MAVEFEDIVIETGEHVVQFYEDDGELARSLARYLGSAIADGGVALAITTEAHGHLLESELDNAGLDPAECRLSGSLILLDAAATMSQFIDEGTVDHDRFRRVVGSVVRRAADTGTPIRAFGEMVALLWEAGNVPAAIELERAWNALAQELPFALVCGYRSESVQGDELADALETVCHLHTSVVSGPTGQASEADRISARFPASRDAPRRARHFVADTLARWGLPAPLLDDARLVVTELTTNAVVHAGSAFAVELRQQDDRVNLAVRDAGTSGPVLREADPLATSGRGLRLVAALAADWGVHADAHGKTVWAQLRA
jgi:anti-sigma regulatory factor (Ser/Thr protein kinase)